MAVPYKKIARKDPRKTDAIEKFYPQLVTLGQSASLESIAYEMKEKSSLSSGDIKSVLTNFVEAMRTSFLCNPDLCRRVIHNVSVSTFFRFFTFQCGFDIDEFDFITGPGRCQAGVRF